MEDTSVPVAATPVLASDLYQIAAANVMTTLNDLSESRGGFTWESVDARSLAIGTAAACVALCDQFEGRGGFEYDAGDVSLAKRIASLGPPPRDEYAEYPDDVVSTPLPTSFGSNAPTRRVWFESIAIGLREPGANLVSLVATANQAAAIDDDKADRDYAEPFVYAMKSREGCAREMFRRAPDADGRSAFELLFDSQVASGIAMARAGKPATLEAFVAGLVAGGDEAQQEKIQQLEDAMTQQEEEFMAKEQELLAAMKQSPAAVWSLVPPEVTKKIGTSGSLKRALRQMDDFGNKLKEAETTSQAYEIVEGITKLRMNVFRGILEETIVTAQAKIDMEGILERQEVQAELNDMQGLVATAEKEVKAMKEQLETAEKARQQMEADLEVQLATAKRERDKAETARKEAEKELAELRGSSDRTFEEHTMKVNGLEAAHNEAKEKLAEVRKELEETRNAVSDTMNVAAAQVEEATKRAEEAEKAREKVEQQLAEAQTTWEADRANLSTIVTAERDDKEKAQSEADQRARELRKLRTQVELLQKTRDERTQERDAAIQSLETIHGEFMKKYNDLVKEVPMAPEHRDQFKTQFEDAMTLEKNKFFTGVYKDMKLKAFTPSPSAGLFPPTAQLPATLRLAALCALDATAEIRRRKTKGGPAACRHVRLTTRLLA